MKPTKMLNILSKLDVIGSFLGIVGLISFFIEIPFKDYLLYTAGIAGFLYWTFYLSLWIGTPVIRDWILVNGHLMRRILCGVLLTPFLLALLCVIITPQLTSTEIFDEFKEKESYVATDNKDQKNTEEMTSLFLNLYYHYMDPGNQISAGPKIGRLWATIVAILGVLLMNGLLVSTWVGWFDRRRDAWQNGDIRYSRFFPHWHPYIIIGGNDMIYGIIKDIFKKDKKSYITIITSRNVSKLRRELFSCLNNDDCLRVIIYYGNRTSVEDINNLQFKKAKEVYILGENAESNEQESNHDTLNMHCLKLVADIYKQQKKSNSKLVCNVMFEYQSTFSIFQFSEISKDINNHIDFRPFNRYEMWAQKVLICKELQDYNQCRYLPLEGIDGIQADSEQFVHFTIVGMSRIGIALAIEAAHLAHYPNFESKHKRTRITFIENNMEQEIDFFKGRFDAMFALARQRFIRVPERHKFYDIDHIYNDFEKYPWIDPLKDSSSNSPFKGEYLGNDFIDIEWEFLEGSIEEPLIQQYLTDAANNTEAKLTLAICLPETNKAVAAAIYLPRIIFEKSIQVLIYQPTDDALISNLSTDKHQAPYNDKIRSFGMLSDTYDASIISDSTFIASRVYNTYSKMNDNPKSYQDLAQKLIQDFINEDEFYKTMHTFQTIKDRSLNENNDTIEKKESEIRHLLGVNFYNKEIDKTPVSTWWSNIYNANILWTKLRCIGYKPGMHMTSKQIWEIANLEHNRWNTEQLLMLYRPVTPEEQTLVLKNRNMIKQLKKLMIHYDICSCNMLKVLDDSFYYDVGFAQDLIDTYLELIKHNQSTQKYI